MFEKILSTVLKASNSAINFVEKKSVPVKVFVAEKSEQIKERVDTEMYKQTIKKGYQKVSDDLIKELLMRQVAPEGFTSREKQLFNKMVEFYDDLKEFK